MTISLSESGANRLAHSWGTSGNFAEKTMIETGMLVFHRTVGKILPTDDNSDRRRNEMGVARFERMAPEGTPPCVVAMMAYEAEEEFRRRSTGLGDERVRSLEEIIQMYMVNYRGMLIFNLM